MRTNLAACCGLLMGGIEASKLELLGADAELMKTLNPQF